MNSYPFTTFTFYHHNTFGTVVFNINRKQDSNLMPRRQQYTVHRLWNDFFTKMKCSVSHTFHIPIDEDLVQDMQDWSNGELIQNIMPYLDTNTREFFINGALEID